MRPDLLPKDLDGSMARFVEEVGECLKPLGKIGRFGLIATDAVTGITYDNALDLFNELHDLEHAILDLRDRLSDARLKAVTENDARFRRELA